MVGCKKILVPTFWFYDTFDGELKELYINDWRISSVSESNCCLNYSCKNDAVEMTSSSILTLNPDNTYVFKLDITVTQHTGD